MSDIVYRTRRGKRVAVNKQVLRWRKKLKHKGVCADKPEPSPVESLYIAPDAFPTKKIYNPFE